MKIIRIGVLFLTTIILSMVINDTFAKYSIKKEKIIYDKNINENICEESNVKSDK